MANDGGDRNRVRRHLFTGTLCDGLACQEKYRNLPDHAPIADSGRFFRMLLCGEYSEKL